MTEHDPKKVAAILQDYVETLEVLTINSKPIINDLTMAADRYKPLAPKIIEKIESRLFEVSAVFSSVLESLVYAYSLCLVWFIVQCLLVWETGFERRRNQVYVPFTSQFSHLQPSVGTLYQLVAIMNRKKMNLKDGGGEGVPLGLLVHSLPFRPM